MMNTIGHSIGVLSNKMYELAVGKILKLSPLDICVTLLDQCGRQIYDDAGIPGEWLVMEDQWVLAFFYLKTPHKPILARALAKT